MQKSYNSSAAPRSVFLEKANDWPPRESGQQSESSIREIDVCNDWSTARHVTSRPITTNAVIVRPPCPVTVDRCPRADPPPWPVDPKQDRIIYTDSTRHQPTHVLVDPDMRIYYTAAPTQAVYYYARPGQEAVVIGQPERITTTTRVVVERDPRLPFYCFIALACVTCPFCPIFSLVTLFIACEYLINHLIACEYLINHLIACEYLINHLIACEYLINHLIACEYLINHLIACEYLINHLIACEYLINHLIACGIFNCLFVCLSVRPSGCPPFRPTLGPIRPQHSWNEIKIVRHQRFVRCWINE